MKWQIIGLILITSMFLISCDWVTEQECINLATREAESWKDIGYGKGLNEGMDICENDLQPKIDQFIPEEDCFIIVYGMSMDYTCKGEEKYEWLQSKRG